MQATEPYPPQNCPLCGQPNQCAMEIERATGIKQPPCWCSQTVFSADALNQIPDAARGKACLCAACASATPCAG
ncbi:cysteine-rich CWC family protein [Rhodoferax sp.]|uniref:cysteine-rich CWC family protein n=1 Tax=Rhodoferax sp. TaxID=50421 RepID=UPI00261F6DA1|nr:cysteine-rich CWC family protein [Rhodoferax sp.]MDD4944148.1 cysteine-rich CWC family protein [Rhodoferax sp.]MDD5478661.1 cysteine-rich CWC family protein [Rhodoferax sp.]